jgi:xylan 1,4-beta-xylosidase
MTPTSRRLVSAWATFAVAAAVAGSASLAAQTPTTPAPAASTPAATGTPFPVAIRVDAAKSSGALHQIWRFFGADEPNYAYMKDGQKLIGDIGALAPKRMYFRAHSLLVTGDGTPALKWGSTNAYTEDASGKAVYDWTIVDRIFDACVSRNVRPFVQVGFMPQALSTRPEPYQHEWRPGLPYDRIVTGWAYPPKDWDKWRELCFRWAEHCVKRYGREEVERWYWEVWNEADGSYWKGTPEEWRKLHDYAIDGVRRALPTARVGGPHAANSSSRFFRDFLEHAVRGKNHATGAAGTPLDFVAFHAKGAPSFVDGHVRMGIANQLRAIDKGFEVVAGFPGLKDKPIVIGESDPDGCAACQGPQLGYRSGTMYSSYTATSFARKHTLADRRGVNLAGALTWAFEFEDQPYFAGQRVLSTNGIALPVLNVFRMFGKMSGKRLAVTSSGEVPLDAILKGGVRAAPDVSALASAAGGTMCVMVWHYHDDDLPGPDAAVDLELTGLPPDARELRVTQYRIDETHSNAYAAWKKMGSPTAPRAEQYEQMRQAGELAEVGPATALKATDGKVTVQTSLPRQAVALFVIEKP